MRNPIEGAPRREPVGFRSRAAGAIAIVGGALMVGSGYTSRGLLYTALGYAAPRIQDILNGAAASIAVLAVTALEFIIALGGVTVAIGGLTVIFGHVSSGRALIWLGGGAGFLGLLVSFGYSAFRLGGLGPVLAYFPYWVGLALAISARRLAKSR